MNGEILTYTYIVAFAAIYFPMWFFMWGSLRNTTSLAVFGRALFRIGEELSNQGEWVNEAIERLKQIYNQSQLHKKFTSMREVVEHLHYLAYAQGSMFWGFVREYRRNESSRNAFLAIRAELAAQDQPYSVLRGDARMLVEAVNANLDPAADGGKVALGRLANYMKGVDKQVTRQRGLNIVFGMVSVVGTVVAIVALVFQVLGSISFAPTT